MKTLTNNDIPIVFSGKIMLVITALVLPLLILSFTDIGDKIDMITAYLIMVIGFPVFAMVLKESLQNALVPYILLQLIYVFIFLGNKIPFPGILKPYVLVFGFSMLVTGYYILKNFKYLWREYIPFRLIFLFLVFNIPYFLFYHSDFRSSNLTDSYEYANMLKDYKTALTLGFNEVGRAFSGAEHKFAIYLGSLSAIVGLTIPLLLFKGVKSEKQINNLILTIIKFILIGFFFHFICAVICLALGLSQIGFIGGRLMGDFIGDIGLGFHLYLSIFLLLFIGFKLFINNFDFKNQKEKTIINWALNFFIVLSLTLVLLHINKTSIVMLGISILLITFFLNYYPGKKFDFSQAFNKLTGLIKFSLVPLILLLILAMANMDMVDNVAERIIDRFSNINTLNDRFTMWNYFIKDWLWNLNLFTFLFGFGIDSGRELAFYTTYILAGRDYHTVHIHNVYLDIFHDYGMIALLYVGSFVYMLINNIKILVSKNINKNLKLFSTISLSLLVFFLVYHMTDALRIPFAIMFFCMLGFLEAVKKAYLSLNREAYTISEN